MRKNPSPLANAALALTLGEVAKAEKRALTPWERKKLTKYLADGETVAVLLGQSIVRKGNEVRNG